MDKTLVEEIAKKVGGKTSIFLGAGASAYLGLPTMVSFLQSAYGEEFVNDIQRGKPYHIATDSVNQTASNETVMATRLFHTAGLHLGKPSIDLEEIFEFIHNSNVMHSQRDVIKRLLWMFKVCSEGTGGDFNVYKANFTKYSTSLEGWMSDFRNTIMNLRKKVYEAFLITSNHSEKMTRLKDSYQWLANLFRDSPMCIFTTNFDTTFEALAGTPDCPFSLMDGFGKKRNPAFDFRNFVVVPFDLPPVYYFKLHGSVTWQRGQKDEIRDSFPHVPESVAVVEPVLSKKPTEYPFTLFYDIFKKVLARNRVCIFIGFSFRDDTIREIVTSRLNGADPFKLFLIAPDDILNPQLNGNISKLADHPNVHWVKDVWSQTSAMQTDMSMP